MFEVWRLQYRSGRYLERLSDGELWQRARDVYKNFFVLRGERTYGKHPIYGDGLYWTTLWAHVCEEYAIRFGWQAHDLEEKIAADLPFGEPERARAKAIWEKLKRLLPVPCPYLVMYGSSEMLRSIVHDGRLHFSFRRPTSDGNLPATADCQPALSGILRARNFVDTPGTDACLLIGNPREFLARVALAAARAAPSWSLAQGPVSYIDPLRDAQADIDGAFRQHFRHAYRKEHRLALVSNGPDQAAGALDIPIGNLEGQGTLIQP